MVLDIFHTGHLDSILRQRRLDLKSCLLLASQIAGLLEGLHAAGLIHRDIRPANLHVELETLRLLDLGHATPQAMPIAPGFEHLAYLSPEQTGRLNRTVDYRSDFYSLGVVLYRMLTGQLPFAAEDALEWAHWHIARMPRPPAELDRAIPQAVSDIVMKLLAKLPDDRYQSARGLKFDLDRCLAQWQAHGRIEAFALGSEDISGRFQIPHRLYGRDEEKRQLLAAFERTAASGQSALVTVSGYAGIGKSALVHELQKPVAQLRGYFIAGKFDQQERHVPYATIAQAFRVLVQQLLSESEARLQAWRERILGVLGVNGQLIVDLLPQIELIIGKQAPVPPLGPTEASNRFHLVLRQFIGIFARHEHPIVIFLDDLQWADAASLHLMGELLLHDDLHYLLLVGAYRDRDAEAVRPLMSMLDEARRQGATINHIALGPVDAEPLAQLIADALHCTADAALPLAALIREKTGGNPFFATQFLANLHERRLIRFDAKGGRWRWNIERIRAQNFTDNVVDLMLEKLARLPERTQQALKQLACLGNAAELPLIALVCGQSEIQTRDDLRDAVRAGLAVDTEDGFRFLHDRVQEAAYSLIPEAARDEAHLRIGRLMKAQWSSQTISDRIFDVVDQLNRGLDRISDPQEKQQLAELNHAAGKRAQEAIAYGVAHACFERTVQLLPATAWHSRYDQAFEACLDLAVCEFLNGRFEQADKWFDVILAHVQSDLDRAKVCIPRMKLCHVTARHAEGLGYALDALRRLGVVMPKHDNEISKAIATELAELQSRIAGRSIAELVSAPSITEPRAGMIITLLTEALSPAYYARAPIHDWLVCKAVNLSLRDGNHPASCRAYTTLAARLVSEVGMIGAFDDIASGFAFSELAVRLNEKFDDRRLRGLVLGNHAAYVAPWRRRFANLLPELDRAIQACIEVGDIMWAVYLSHVKCGRIIEQGVAVDEMRAICDKYLALARQHRYKVVHLILTLQRQFCISLKGQQDTAGFGDERFDEARCFAELLETRDPLAISHYYVLKQIAAFIDGRPADALQAARQAMDQGGGVRRFILASTHMFFHALSVAALFPQAAADEQRQFAQTLETSLANFKFRAEQCPENWLDRYALLAAENARIQGRDMAAMRLYQQAANTARDNGFAQNEAIACELAARFYSSRSLHDVALVHLRRACAAYARWGATDKVRQLKARHPGLGEENGRVQSGLAQLDVLSVTKASQAISGRIVLDEVIDTLLRIVIENAGAQSGCLLLMRGGQIALAAEAQSGTQSLSVNIEPDPARLLAALPAGVLNYVRRSRDKVLLANVENAAAAQPFSEDPTLARRGAKSVLCLPILRQSALIGLLYLENTLVTDAFTPERLAVLELLASQAAISLENAQLYGDLQQEIRERRRAEDALREREARIRRLVEANIIGVCFWEVGRGIVEANDAFLRIIGYTRKDFQAGQIDWNALTPAEYREADRQWIASSQRGHVRGTYEKEFIRKDGSRVSVLIGSAFFEDSREGGLAFVLDLTERRQAEADRQARRGAEAANKAKSDFLSSMSHELRTPLNGILGYAQILLRDRALNKQQAYAVNVIHQSGEHLLTLINDILDLAKIEAGKLDLQPDPVGLAGFLEIVAQTVDIKAKEKGLDFRIVAMPGLPSGILADEQRLRQVLLNLLANAVRFTDRGRVTLVVGAPAPDRLRFEVRDTGIGIPSDRLDTIFQPFEQIGDSRHKIGGTGLGLPISRQLVRLMGGEIQVESHPGEGSRFWFELHLPAAQTRSMPAASAAQVQGYEGERRTILVVDDIEQNRAMLVDLLAPLGFRTIEAEDVVEALAKTQDLRPDLLLMDLVMPVSSGNEAITRLRQLGAKLPIIAISAGASASDRARALAAGANAFLPKPVDLHALLELIGLQLGLRWIHASADEREADETGPLIAPPVDEMTHLHRLAQFGDMQGILRDAERLERSDPRWRAFAAHLRRLAHGYQSKAILQFVERYFPSGEPPNAS